MLSNLFADAMMSKKTSETHIGCLEAVKGRVKGLEKGSGSWLDCFILNCCVLSEDLVQTPNQGNRAQQPGILLGSRLAIKVLLQRLGM